MKKARIAVVHPWLVEGGGSETVALWTAQALKDDYDVTLITMGEAELADLDRTYGTSLDGGGIRFLRLPIPRLLRRRGDALRSFRLSRFCRARAASFQLMISSYNVMDFGRPGLQYVSDFSFDDNLRRAFLADARNWRQVLRPPGPLRAAYLASGRMLAGSAPAGWRRNRTLANSEWTRSILGEVFGVEAETVYPPVLEASVRTPWESRQDVFLAIGRIVPEKRVDVLIDILSEVRRRGTGLQFRVLGRVPDNPYGRSLREKQAAAEGWVSLDGPLFGEAKFTLLSRSRYGISACPHEAFGVAVAEMVRSGMIVWVPDSGGQVEIVGHPELVYSDPADAADKIARVLGHPSLQAELREHLALRSGRFSHLRFTPSIRAAAARCLEDHAR